MAGLTESDVRRLRQLKAEGRLNVRSECMFYGLAAETIRRAVRGETWTHLQMQVPKTNEELDAAAAASLEKLQRMLAGEKERIAAPDRMIAELKGEPHDAGYGEE